MEYLGYNDAPITDLEKDLFQVDKYVNGLCKFILECETPMTVSIQGDWGSGKTSMMNMIQSQLGNKVLPIWFNTWQFSQFNLGNSLAISMLQVLLKELKGDTEALDKIAESMTNLAGNALLTLIELSLGSRMAVKLKKHSMVIMQKVAFKKLRNSKRNSPKQSPPKSKPKKSLASSFLLMTLTVSLLPKPLNFWKF